STAKQAEPRWPAVVAILAVGGIYLGMPSFLTLGPRWLLLLLVSILLVPTIVSHRLGNQKINRIFGTAVTFVITLAMIISIWLLVKALPEHRESPVLLLQSAMALWVTNVLVFATWYWRLDAGGPNQRDLRLGHEEGAFLFPQMTLSAHAPGGRHKLWSPHFVD